MKATDLEDRLASLGPGETLVFSVAEIEQAFQFCPTREERYAAATRLAALYGCSLLLRGPDARRILVTRHRDPRSANFQ